MPEKASKPTGANRQRKAAWRAGKQRAKAQALTVVQPNKPVFPARKPVYSQLHHTLHTLNADLGSVPLNGSSVPFEFVDERIFKEAAGIDTDDDVATTTSYIQPPLSRGFGMKEHVPANMYMKMPSGSNTGSVTTNTELGLTVTDFFDYSVKDTGGSGVPQVVTNYFWDCNQNLFENGTSIGPFTDNEVTFCRVRSLQVYVLPVKGFEIGAAGVGNPNQTNAEGMFTVQAQVPGVTSRTTTGPTPALAMDTQVTNVLPQIDTFWKKVLHCDLQKTFQSGVARPFFDDTSDKKDLQCLFQMAIVDPTDGQTYLTDNDDVDLTIRVKVVLQVDQPIATIQRAQLNAFRNETFLYPSTAQNGPAFPGTRAQYVQTNLRRVSNHMR